MLYIKQKSLLLQTKIQKRLDVNYCITFDPQVTLNMWLETLYIKNVWIERNSMVQPGYLNKMAGRRWLKIAVQI